MRRVHRALAWAAAITFVGANVPAHAATAATGGPILQVSMAADRNKPVNLDHARVHGKVYITLGGDTRDVASVAFRLDNPLGRVRLTEKTAPFDFAGAKADGAAKPFDTATAGKGAHVVMAEIVTKDGREINIYSRFTVDGTPAPAPSPKPSSTPTGKPTPAPSPSGKPTPAPSPSGSPGGGRACPPPPAYPTPDCTGVPDGTKLVTVNGNFTADKPGQVVKGVRITGKLVVKADGVEIRDSEIHGGVSNYGGSDDRADYRFTITDSTIGAATGCDGYVGVGFSNYTATRVHIHNFGDGFRDSGDNILVQDSFVTLCSNTDDHSDGIQGYKGGKNVVIRHNTIDQRPTRFIGTTSPIFFADESAGAVLTDNLLAGGGYTVRLHGSGFVFKDNRVVKDSWNFGPVYSDCGGISWSGNATVAIDANYSITSTIGALPCK